MTDLKYIETIIEPNRRFPFVQLEDLDPIGENLVSRLRRTKRKLTAGQESLKECQSVFHRLLRPPNSRQGLSSSSSSTTVCYFCGHKYHCSKLLKRHYQSHTKENYKDFGFGRSKLTLAASENQDRKNEAEIMQPSIPLITIDEDQDDGNSVALTCSDRESDSSEKPNLEVKVEELFEEPIEVELEEPNLEKFYLCEVCGLTTFLTDFEYETHLKNHEDEPPPSELDLPSPPIQIHPKVQVQVYRNPLNEEFVYAKDLIEPFATTTINSLITLPKKFKCSKCTSEYRTEVWRDKHEKTHDRKFKCPFCNLNFPTTYRRNRHQKSVHNVHGRATSMLYKCEPCEFYFQDEAGFNYHQLHAHSESTEVQSTIQIDPQVEVQVYPTELNEELPYSEDITDPFATVPDPKPKKFKFKCPFCNLNFPTTYRRDVHKKAVHNVCSSVLFQCQPCDFYFQDKAGFDYHKAHAHPNDIVVDEPHNQLRTASNEENQAIMNSIICHKSSAVEQDLNQKGTIIPTADKFPKKRVHRRAIRPKAYHFPCQPCQIVFSTERGLNFHKSRAHPNNEIITEEEYQAMESSSPLIKPKKKKLKFHSLKTNHKCSKCQQTFSTSNKVRDHEKHHGDTYSCNFCLSGFKTKKRLSIHTKMVHPEEAIVIDTKFIPNSLKCLKCNQTFMNPYQKNRHDKNFHKNLSGFEFKCFKCFEGFMSRAALMKHNKSKTHKNNSSKQVVQIQCPLCPEIFSTDVGMKIHKSVKHKDPDSINNKVTKCSKCDETFSTTSQVLIHERTHGDKWPCDLCPAVFKMNMGVLNHREKMHPLSPQYTFKPKQIFKCLICNPVREFDTVLKQRLHGEEVHKDTFEFKCSVCEERYKTLAQKIKHEKSHPKNLPCPECPHLIFATDRGLLIHQSKFHPMQLKCSKCDETFRSESQRDIHESKHGDKWPCELCTVAFKTRIGLVTHRSKWHPGAEPYASTFQDDPMSKSKLTVKETPKIVKIPLLKKYPCIKCLQTFTTEVGAKIHKRSHGKNWFCELCFAGFKFQMGLCRHRQAVHPGAKKYRWKTTFQVADFKIFQCSQCSLSFTTDSRRKLHEKLKHLQVLESELESQNSNGMGLGTEQVSIVDPLTLVSVSMDGIKEEIPSNQMGFEVNESSCGLVNMEEVQEVVVKPEIEDLIWLKSETE